MFSILVVAWVFFNGKKKIKKYPHSCPQSSCGYIIAFTLHLCPEQTAKILLLANARTGSQEYATFAKINYYINFDICSSLKREKNAPFSPAHIDANFKN